MVSRNSTEWGSVPPASLLGALSQAFAYPWNGIGETLEALESYASELQAHSDDDSDSDGSEGSDGWAHAIAEVLEIGGTFETRTDEQLAYTRLFIGSFKMEAPPYASYYLGQDHTLNGQAAAEVEAVYAQFGLELDSSEIAPPDHLRYLLAFLSLVAARFEETDEEAFAQAYADFRDEYVLTWIDQCQALVDKYAEHPYYPALIALIVSVLKENGVCEPSADQTPEGE